MPLAFFGWFLFTSSVGLQIPLYYAFSAMTSILYASLKEFFWPEYEILVNLCHFAVQLDWEYQVGRED
jgi:hypothetical protein